MEQHGKEKRNIEEKREKDAATEEESTQSKSTSSLPLDLASDILLRLPEKSIARFRCVSKLWSSVSTNPYFINLFESRSLTRPSLLLCFRKGDQLCVYSIPQHVHTLHQNSNKSYSSSQPIDRYHMKLPEGFSDAFSTESVHGLICFHGSVKPIVIWNPSKRQFFTLPNPSWHVIKGFLGYDPIKGKHKVMCMPSRGPGDMCQVLTLGSAQESWRTVKTNHKHLASSGRCINGVIYYIADWYSSRPGDYAVMSFDVRYEIFGMVDCPSDISMYTLINYEGRLACIDIFKHERLWILEDAEKHKWSNQDFLSPLGHYEESLNTIFKLKGITPAGEFILVPSELCDSHYILFYDPVRNSSRRFEFKQIAEEEFGLIEIKTKVGISTMLF